MIDPDLAALAAARDFSNGIAVWRATQGAVRARAIAPPSRNMMPVLLAAFLTIVNCALLSVTLLPSTAGL